MFIVRGLLAAILWAAIPFIAVHSLSRDASFRNPQAAPGVQHATMLGWEWGHADPASHCLRSFWYLSALTKPSPIQIFGGFSKEF